MINKIGKRIFEILTKISPKFSAIILYIYRTKEIPNLKNPKNFNEKMTKLKLENYNKKDKISILSDKYAVRQYVKEKGCKEILNEFYGVYDDIEKINFETLPEKFALKCTHGCAYNVICRNKKKLNIEKTKNKLNAWMKEKYGYATQELHYTKIKPRIIAEKYLCDENDEMPLDYKIYCFNGKAECILVCSERDKKLKLSYHDMNWNRIEFEKKKWSSIKDIEKPNNLTKMVEYAEKLSSDFPFVRVDLYEDKGKIIFGELTFTPACCCAPYYSKEGNKILGNMLKL